MRLRPHYLTPHDLEDSKIAFESMIVELRNWKPVWENDCKYYHCSDSHKRSVPQYSER
ncbi:hypothetical protein [Sinisalibacter aestuarii]|uniref:Uncharacterized protein n=1 Tax=Sinisalibacter aestuarii TaxID=2949426 RepID=A0ABQ5LW86_9RHOB|nr:hypothetical protein [Sinisalibacter aestuarii]GKY89252.1 hypothetical protein STA1M1_31210 [Sinisalibacter aestuarii]